MTWGNPLPWRCVFDDHAAVVRVLDDIGGLQAVATLDAAGRATGPVVAQIPEPQARPGLLDRLDTGVDRLDQSLQAAIDSTAREASGCPGVACPKVCRRPWSCRTGHWDRC